MYWYPDRLLRVVMFWLVTWLVFSWLVVVRGGVDPRYVWGFLSFRGPGATGDYWGMVVVATFAWSTLYLGARGARAPFHAMLLAWNAIFTTIFTRYAIEAGAGATLEGNAWGFEISLQYAGPILFGTFSLLALVWVIRDLLSERSREVKLLPNPKMKRLLGIAITVTPVQLALFRFGADNGSLHATAVGLTIIQVLAGFLAMLPGQPTALTGSTAAPAARPASPAGDEGHPTRPRDEPAQTKRLAWIGQCVKSALAVPVRPLPGG